MRLIRLTFTLSKKLLYVTFTTTALTGLLVGIGLFTHKGNTLVFNALHEWDPRLNIALKSGSVFNKPTYESISWSDKETTFEFKGLSYELNWQCLLKELCIESLTLESTQIHVANTDHQSTPELEKKPPFVLKFPIPVSIKHLNLNHTNINVAGVKVDLQELVLSAKGIDNNISLNTTINGLTVILPDSKLKKTAVNKTNQLTSLPAILDEKTLPEVILPFNLEVEKLNINGFKVIQNQQDLFVLNDAKSEFTYYGSRIDINKFELDLPEANTELTGKIYLTDRYAIDINAKIDIKNIPILQPSNLLAGQSITLRSKGDLGKLHSDIKLRHLINANIESDIDLYSDNLPHRLNLQWQNINWPLTGSPQVKISEGNILSEGKVNNYHLKMEGDYQLTDLPAGKVNLQAQGNLQSLSLTQLLVNTLQGRLSLKGKLNWINEITWLGNLNLHNINFSELNEDYPKEINGDIKQSFTMPLNDKNKPAWAFNLPDINVNGALLDHSLTLTGMAKGDANNGVDITDIKVMNENNSFSINGKIADKSDLDVALDIKALSKILPNSIGKIKGKIKVTGSIDKIDVNTELKASNIAYFENSLEQLNLNGKATIEQFITTDLALKIQNIKVADQDIETLSINIRPEKKTKKESQHTINLDLQSELFNTNLEALFSQQLNEWYANLNQGSIETIQGIWSLNNPVEISIKQHQQEQKQQQINLTEHCWVSSHLQQETESKICINKFLAGKDGDININIDDFLLSTLSPLIPENLALEGDIDAGIDLLWRDNQHPMIDLHVDSSNIALNIKTDKIKENDVRYPLERFNATLKSDKQKINFLFNADSKGLINSHLQGSLLPYQSQPGIAAKLDLLLTDLDAFSILIPEVEKLTGQLKTNVDINGLLEKPTIKGQLLIVNSTVKSVASPIQITDLNSNIEFDENTATVTGHFFTNKKEKKKYDDIGFIDGLLLLKDVAVNTVNLPQRIVSNDERKVEDNNGRADISGFFNWKEKLTGNIQFQANGMRINDYGKTDVYVSPKINLVFDEHIRLQGDINVDKGTINVKELPEGAVSVSKDVIVVDEEDKKDATDLPIIMNVNVDLGNQLHIKAIGLDSYIHGNLLVRKKLLREPTINGVLTFSEGSYRALAQQLVLQNSRVTFQGPADSPYLYIEAIRDPSNIEDDVTAGVRVTGTPEELQLTIFSDPSMSQQDALSYITRGNSIENSSSSSNNQLTSILIDLGAGQTDDIMNNIGSKVGISDLSLASSGQGDEQSVGVKGTIVPGVELSYGVGVFDTFTIFAIRYELFEKFYIEASSGLYQAVDAYYEWDWDYSEK